MANNPNNNPYKIPRIIPTRISFNIIDKLFPTLTRPVASPLTTNVDVCVPILPPIPMITGINAARARVSFIVLSKKPITEAAQIPPTQLANNQGNLLLALSHDDFISISLSLPAPAI